MLPDVSKYILRNPRHTIQDGSEAHVELKRSPDREPVLVTGILVDFSRHGMQAQTDGALQVGEDIVLRLHHAESGFEVLLDATVQWQREADEQSFSVGCMFKDEVAWETLGELFLNGILSQ